MKEMKKRFLSLVMLLVLCLSMAAVPAFATEGDTTEPDSNAAVGGGVAQTDDPVLTDTPTDNTETTDTDTETSTDQEGYYGDIPSSEEVLGIDGDKVVTTTDVSNWLNRKGGEVVSIVELAVRWISVFFFFVSLVFVVVGSLGNKRTMVAGFIGMAVCCVIFAVATCGPQIMELISSWLRS